MRLSIGIIAGTLAIAAMDYADAQSCGVEPFDYDLVPELPNNAGCRISTDLDVNTGRIGGVMTCAGTNEQGVVTGDYYPDGYDPDGTPRCMVYLQWSFPSIRPSAGDSSYLQYRSSETGIIPGVQSDTEACTVLSAASPEPGYLSMGDELISTEIWREGTPDGSGWMGNLRCRYSVWDFMRVPQTRLGKGSITCIGDGACAENPRVKSRQTVSGTWRVSTEGGRDQLSPVEEATIRTGGNGWNPEYVTVPLGNRDPE